MDKGLFYLFGGIFLVVLFISEIELTISQFKIFFESVNKLFSKKSDFKNKK